MRYIDQLLGDDEPLLYFTQMSVWANMGKLLLALTLMLLGVYAYVAKGEEVVGLSLFLIIAGIATALYAKALQTSMELAVTDRRVLAKTGLFSRDAFEVNLSKIEGAQIQQSIMGRMLGYGTVTIRGVGDPMPPLNDVDGPVEFRNALVQAADGWNSKDSSCDC